MAAIFLVGCGDNLDLPDAYSSYENAYMKDQDSSDIEFFSKELCVTPNKNFGTDKVASNVAEAAGVFNVTEQEVTYAQNIYEKLYPASTTKILTAYIILNKCNLDDVVTVSDNAVKLASDASNCGLKSGDMISVKDLLYGLMLPSGNDAANALAEYCSGSREAFSDLMNETAAKLGANHSHFTNPSGLPDEEHYTCVYDMYLIFNECIKNDMFLEIVSTKSYEAKYKDIQGNNKKNSYSNTNRYFAKKNHVSSPEGITIIGGKTGTTNAAGNCLVLLSENAENERIISIVFKGDSKNNLYYLMNQILSGFGQ